MADTILEIKDLKQYFSVKNSILQNNIGTVKAVDGVTFTINKGEAFGLVGESGSGKTTIGRAVVKLSKKTDGDIIYNGKNIYDYTKKEQLEFRKKVQYIFQDPYSSLNPRMRVGDAIGEPLIAHGLASKENVREKVIEILKTCGLEDYYIDRFPHQFSGGQRQRIVIARAIALAPEFIVADEPVSSLDVSIQAQIINLFSDLRKEKGLAYLFISHDLSVVEHLCDKIAIIYLGNIVEIATSDEIFNNPKHPYTKALISAIPSINPEERKKKIILEGDIPSASNPPSGCKFHTRCPNATDRCKKEVPEFLEREKGHFVSCHLCDK